MFFISKSDTTLYLSIKCEDVSYHNVKKVEVKDIPEDYLSEKDIFCEKELIKDFSKIFDYINYCDENKKL